MKPADLFALVMTPAQIESEFDLPPGSVRRDIRRGKLPAHRADQRTWLILRSEAERYYGHRTQPHP